MLEAGRAVPRDGRAVLCHIVRTEGSTPGKTGWRLLLRRDGSVFGNLGGGAFEALVKVDAEGKLADPRAGSEVKRYYFTETAVKGEPTGMVCGGLSEVFLEVLMADPVLVICGGGPVGQALARAGELGGFHVVVAEDRDGFRRPALFPDGVELATVDADYGQDFLAPWLNRDLHVCVVTRCWETDTAALASVLRQAPPHLRYLGLMGSRRKVERVRGELAGLDAPLSLEDIQLHAPIGLPIGGDSPGEIAISILAQVLQVRHGEGEPAEPAADTSDERQPEVARA